MIRTGIKIVKKDIEEYRRGGLGIKALRLALKKYEIRNCYDDNYVQLAKKFADKQQLTVKLVSCEAPDDLNMPMLELVFE